jgi:hypothetical protein
VIVATSISKEAVRGDLMASAPRTRQAWFRVLVTGCASLVLSFVLALLAFRQPPPAVQGYLNALFAVGFAAAGAFALRWGFRLRRGRATGRP